jgi:beta-glucosidase
MFERKRNTAIISGISTIDVIPSMCNTTSTSTDEGNPGDCSSPTMVGNTNANTNAIPSRTTSTENDDSGLLHGAEAKTLLQQLSRTQKVRLLSGASMWTLKPVKSLGLPKIWISDGPHGLRKQHDEWVTELLSGRIAATCFPTASCLACSWDPSLLEHIGQALGRECRANSVSVLLGPGVNLIRHPCGGRNFEYYSEDPFLTGRMAAALVQGVQSQGIGVSLKHFLCNNQETWRFVLDVIVDERTQRELYEPAFEHVIRTCQPWTIMTAYNRVNGIFASENPIVRRRIREEWNFQGLVMTDWGATNDRVHGIQAGIDLEMPGSVGACDDTVINALNTGELAEEDLDKCVTRVLRLILNCKEQLEHSADESENGSQSRLDANHELARNAAMQSIVLLKNENHVLPLVKDVSVAVIGAFAKEPRFQGMGSSEVNAYKVDSAWDRIQEYTKNAMYAPGYIRLHPEGGHQELIDEAVDIAKKADVVLIFCGLNEISESEAFDRADCDLSPGHDELVKAVAEANPKTVVVLSNGSAVVMPWAQQVSGIVESWLGGQAGASATVDLLFGIASPSGKLSQSFPHKMEDLPSANWFPGVERQVQYREGLNVGYRYFNSADKDVLFPFGHGLSYSKFEFRKLTVQVASPAEKDTLVIVSVEIENVGTVEAAEVVQCYVHDVDSSVYRPYHELKGFQKVMLKPQQKTTVSIALDKRAFSLWDIGAKQWLLEAGEFEIQIGSSSKDIRLRQKVALESSQIVSLEARKSHPSLLLPLTTVNDSDEHFLAMMGSDVIPGTHPTTTLHHNSLLGDTQHTFIGRTIKSTGLRLMLKAVKDPPEHQVKFSQELLDNSPLRSLVLFSRGGMSYSLLDVIIHIMNGEILAALWKLPVALVDLLYEKIVGSRNRV